MNFGNWMTPAGQLSKDRQFFSRAQIAHRL
jgi:hypothetical protein